MTLFIKQINQSDQNEISYEINELYVLALAFCISFLVGKIIKAVVKKLNTKKEGPKQIPNPRGGGKIKWSNEEDEEVRVRISENPELAMTILSCIAENESYLLKNKKIRTLIFYLVKVKILNESLVLTPNRMRLFALNLLEANPTLLTKIGNFARSSTNRVQFLTRFIAVSTIAVTSAIFSFLFPYGILLLMTTYDLTENCAYQCHHYFEHLPKEGGVEIYQDKPTGHLIITGNNDARQVEIYIPSKASNDVVTFENKNKEVKVEKTYKKSAKKAREVKFSDFKKTDPLLSSMHDLEEHYVPQKTCPINEIPDIVDKMID